MFEAEKRIAEAQEKFNEMVRYVRQDGASDDAYRAEVRLFRNVLALGRYLLAAWRDPEGRKKRAGLNDAGTGLQRLALTTLPGFLLILDLFHALEYLWKAAHVFHPEGSEEAEAFVRERLVMLLEGEVGYVIGGLRQTLTKHRRRLRKPQRKVLQTVIGHSEANRRWMHCDEYLAAGYPIGSGAVEGACRHLVKDRMEGSGMRWSLPSAGAILNTRAVYLNGDWEPFWCFRMHRDAPRRFGGRRWHPLAHSATAQAAA